MGAPAPALGDPPELLDVDVHQLARARRARSAPAHRPAAHRLAGERVQLAQRGHLVARQHPADRRGREPELGADPVGPASMDAPRLEDPRLDRRRGAVRAVMGPARAIGEAAWALGAEAPQPLVGGGPRAAHLVGDIGRAMAGQDPFNEQGPSVNGQTGVSVGHEDLRGVDGFDTSTNPRGPSLRQPGSVNNAPGDYT